MKTYVSITLEIPLDAIDFSDCDGGCLNEAKFKDVPILCFHSDDVDRATAKMLEDLGERTECFNRWEEIAIKNDREAKELDAAMLARDIRNEHLNDSVSMSRRGGI